MAPQAPPAPGNTPTASILVVDDDPDLRSALCDVLEEEGYEALPAANGRVALDRLLRGPAPDLILTDLVMPVLDGWQLLAELRLWPDLAAIPVVVMSGARARGSASVPARRIDKPLTRAQLLDTVAACLARGERRASGIVRKGT